jgi:hypothetical protein
MVRPPVADQFLQSPLSNRRGRVVGVSGVVYASGRKNERLIIDLANDEGITIRAAGHGWPIATNWYPWVRMPRFYRGLDVFLVTALIEGIPMPPLEALACGVPIVIPHNVGLLDELPDMPGIVRYVPGDYTSMRAAIECALEVDYVPQALRSIVAAQYTAQTWAQDHIAAMEQLAQYTVARYPVKPAATHGIYIVAFGAPARQAARALIMSIRRYLSCAVAVVSDVPLDAGEEHFIKSPDRDVGGRWAKLSAYELSPFEHTLYLDADMRIVSSAAAQVFEFLRAGYDMVFSHSCAKYAELRRSVRPDNKPEWRATVDELGSEHLLQLHGGLWGFNRSVRVQNFFTALLHEYDRWGQRDQLAIMRAMYRSPVCMYLLGQDWNIAVNHRASPTAIIEHHHGMAQRVKQGSLRCRWDAHRAMRKA